MRRSHVPAQSLPRQQAAPELARRACRARPRGAGCAWLIGAKLRSRITKLLLHLADALVQLAVALQTTITCGATNRILHSAAQLLASATNLMLIHIAPVCRLRESPSTQRLNEGKSFLTNDDR